MEKAQIEIGTQYAFRENPSDRSQPFRVEVIGQTKGGRWRIKFFDGEEEGNIQNTASKNIIWRWTDNKSRMKQEQNADALWRSVSNSWSGYNDPEVSAMDFVFEAAGEPVIVTHGQLSIDLKHLERLCFRAGIEVPELTFPAYKDHRGQLIFPWTVALDLAKQLCRHESSTALAEVDSQEREFEIESHTLGGSQNADLWRKYRPIFAIVRQWCGFDDALGRKDKEIQRLKDIISQTIWQLKSQGMDSMARRLETALMREDPSA